jgi:hypothetical protein
MTRTNCPPKAITPNAKMLITIKSVKVVAATTLCSQRVSRIVNGITKIASIKPAAKGIRKRCPHHNAAMTDRDAMILAAVLERMGDSDSWVEFLDVDI